MSAITADPTTLAMLAGQVLLAVALFGWMKYTFMILFGLSMEEQPASWSESFEVGLRHFPKAMAFGLLAFLWLDIVTPINTAMPSGMD